MLCLTLGSPAFAAIEQCIDKYFDKFISSDNVQVFTNLCLLFANSRVAKAIIFLISVDLLLSSVIIDDNNRNWPPV